MFLRKIPRPGRTQRASRKLLPSCARSLVFEEMCAASRTELVEPGGGLRVTGGRYGGCSSPFRMKRLSLHANRSTDDLRGLERWGFQSCRSCPSSFGSFMLLFRPQTLPILSDPPRANLRLLYYREEPHEVESQRACWEPGRSLVLCARGGGTDFHSGSVAHVVLLGPHGGASPRPEGVFRVRSDQGCPLLSATSMEVLK